MRQLLDECIDERLPHLFPAHECHSARYAGLAGLANGRLLAAAEAAGYSVILTVDQNIPEQQNITNRQVSLVVLCAATNRLNDLKPLVPAALAALESMQSGQVVRIR